MVVGLGGDVDLGGCLCGQRHSGKHERGEEQAAFHESRF
jgi:hypothetical protein